MEIWQLCKRLLQRFSKRKHMSFPTTSWWSMILFFAFSTQKQNTLQHWRCCAAFKPKTKILGCQPRQNYSITWIQDHGSRKAPKKKACLWLQQPAYPLLPRRAGCGVKLQRENAAWSLSLPSLLSSDGGSRHVQVQHSFSFFRETATRSIQVIDFTVTTLLQDWMQEKADWRGKCRRPQMAAANHR